MLLISRLMTWRGMFSHSWCSARSRSLRLLTSLRRRTLRPRQSQRCSIGDKSEDLAGQLSTCTLFRLRKSWVTLAVCGLALSCCRTSALPWRRNGKITGPIILSRYPIAVRLPLTVTSCVAPERDMPPHTITLPPPNRSRSTMFGTSKRSLFRLHTRSLPSAAWRLNLDSSVNTTLGHCYLVQARCARAQFKRARRWRCVNGTPTKGRLPRNAAALRRLRTVPNVTLVPVAACKRFASAVLVKNRLRRDDVTRYLSSRCVVFFGLPDRGLSFTLFVCLHLDWRR